MYKKQYFYLTHRGVLNTGTTPSVCVCVCVWLRVFNVLGYYLQKLLRYEATFEKEKKQNRNTYLVKKKKVLGDTTVLPFYWIDPPLSLVQLFLRIRPQFMKKIALVVPHDTDRLQNSFDTYFFVLKIKSCITVICNIFY